jgi:hypothetical protein
MNQNGGLGAVVQKNVQLTNFKASDCVAAVKHGNGRDWWVFFRRWDTVNDEYYRFLVSPSGVSGPFIQNIGTATDNGFMHSTFSKDGTKYLMCDYRGLIELYDFDRCTGLFTNVTQIEPEQPPGSFPAYFGCEFSVSGRYIYVSSNNDVESLIVQFDLWAPNISSSKDTIVYLTIPPTGGLLKRGPDDKIYFSCVYNDGVNMYPYPETATSIYNLNLSVINDPDSAGASCNFTPFSFNLGGNETYWGLPNNPDYDLPALAGSPCDTLVGIGEAPPIQQAALNVFYHTAWEKAFINASNLKGKNGKLLVYDMRGKIIHQEPLRIQNGYYTRDLSMQGKAHGVYLVIVQTEEERLTKKIITE